MSFYRYLVSLSALALCASACAEVAPDEAAGDDVEVAAQAQTSPKVTITKVEPLGDGCEAGSYTPSISADGTKFTLKFTKYSVKVSPEITNMTDARSCNIAVTMKTPAGLSYAVTSVQFNGTGMLESGVTGVQTVRYSFNGAGAIPRTLTQNLTGPIKEGPYSYNVPVTTNDQVYSACGTERQLMLNTTMSLRNSTPKKTGYLNATDIQATAQTNVVLNLSLVPCGGNGN